MTQELFRREVLDARSGSNLGEVSLSQPLPILWLALGTVVSVALIIVFLALGEYSRRSRVVGYLVPDRGISTVVAPTRGIVSRVMVNEGDRVTAGGLLAHVDVPRFSVSGARPVTVIRSEMDKREVHIKRVGEARLAQTDAQIAGLAAQIDVAKVELRQIEAGLATRDQQIRLGRKTLARFRELASLQYVSPVQLDQQEQALLELLNERHALDRQRSNIKRGILQAEQSVREQYAQRKEQEASTGIEQAQLNQERALHETNGELVVKAPLGGIVASRVVEPGQAVEPGQILVSLVPFDSNLQAQLLVPSRAIGFIEPGDAVLLRYQAFPYQKFGHMKGFVRRVSRSAASPSDWTALLGSAPSVEPYYRVIVDIDEQSVKAYGKREPLRPGMMLEADILGERRKLYEWLLEPLYSVRGTVGGGGN